jgi:drug/metabolite transporter superfamily protein YnfA
VPYGLLADLVVVLHLAFVAFVVAGGLLVIRWPRLAWVHVPAAVWGALIEFAGWICPLTPVENSLRQRAGETAYEGDFIARHLMWLVYPEGLTRRTQILVGVAALLVNAAIYLPVLQRLRHRRQCSPLRPE